MLSHLKLIIRSLVAMFESEKAKMKTKNYKSWQKLLEGNNQNYV